MVTATRTSFATTCKRVTADLRQTRRRLREVEERQPGADRDRRDELPLPGRGRTRPEELWRAGRRRAGRDRRVPRPTAAGTSTALYDPDPDRPGTSVRHARAASCTTRRDFDAGVLRDLARARRWRWTRSSGCCWRRRGRRSSGPASTRPRCAAAAPACSPGSCTTTTPRGCDPCPTASRATSAPAARAASPPAGSPTPSAWRARRSRSTRRARRRWWRCTWRCRRCARASARWRWPAA